MAWVSVWVLMVFRASVIEFSMPLDLESCTRMQASVMTAAKETGYTSTFAQCVQVNTILPK